LSKLRSAASDVGFPWLCLSLQGRDLERTVLAKAVRWHLQDRVIVHNNKTVVFE
jgi:formyltetrahydrofolate hydrolase